MLRSRSSSADSPPATSSTAITVSSTSPARRRGLEPDQPDGAGQRAPGRDRERGLADPAGPDDLDEPAGLEEARDGGDLGVAPDELGRQRRQVAGRRAQRGVVLEHLLLELPQPRAGLEPEVVAQPRAGPAIGGERVGLAPGAVERGDQELPQPLAVRVGGDGRLQLADHVVFPEPHAGRELRRDEMQARLVEPAAVRLGPVAGRGQQLAAVARQRRGAQLGRGAGLAGVEPLRRRGGVGEHDDGVDGRRVDGERVAAVAAHDRLRIAERATEPGDLRLQRVGAGVDRVGAPQLVDEPVRAHPHPGVEREAHQQLGGPAARDREAPAVAADLDRAQHRDLEHAPSLWRCQRRVSALLHGCRMPPPEQLIHRLATGDAEAIAAIVEASRTSDDPAVLVAAALFAPDGDGLLERAGAVAATTRDRQLVAIAGAHLQRPHRSRRRARARPPRRPPRQRPRRLDRGREPIHEGAGMNPKLTASLLILAAVLANVGFTALGSIFNYPDVLDEPAGKVLADFRAHESAVSAWFSVLALSAALMAPIAIGVGRLSSERAMRIAVRVGIAAAVVQVIGLLRWPILVPGYAADGNTSAFSTASDILGTAIGETVGYLLTATWTALVVIALGRRYAGRWFQVLGLASAALVLCGVVSPLGLPVIDTANFFGYVLWSLWLIAFGVVILLQERRAGALSPAAVTS